MFPRHLTVSFLILLLITCTSGSVYADECPSRTMQSDATPDPGDLTYLTDIDPIIGDDSTYSTEYMGTWHAEDLQISSTGEVSGTLHVQYKYKSIEGEKFVDILRFQVKTTYILPCYGDTVPGTLCTFIPIYAVESTDDSATFLINVPFDIPPATHDFYDIPLHDVELSLTWHRVTEVQPDWIMGDRSKVGATQTSSDDRPELRLSFDKPPKSFSGSLYLHTETASEYEPYNAWLLKTYPNWFQFAAKHHLRLPLVLE